MIVSTLAKKELKQNAVIYTIPYLVFVALWLIFRDARFLPEKWVGILTVALPVAIAGAYGLQAFDLEENGQTRDFLLVKPITISQILWTKFYTGLLVLLPVTLIWINWLSPKTFGLPNLVNPASIWGLTVVLLVLTIYVVAFTVSIFIKGPLKIVGTIFILPIVGGWFVFAWSQLLTPIFWNNWLFANASLSLLCFIAATLFPTVMLILTALRISGWYISQQAFSSYQRNLATVLLICLTVPLFFWGLNQCIKPVISPFTRLSASLLGIDDWFIAVEGLKQPSGNQYAITDVQGRLGLAKAGQKTRIVYSAKPGSESATLSNLSWSPNGTKVAFCQNHSIRVYTLKSGSVKTIAAGDIPLWSGNSDQLLIAKYVRKQSFNSPGGPVERKQYQLSLNDLSTGRSVSYGILNSTGSSIAWDPLRNRILTIDFSGNIIIIDLAKNQTKSSSLLSGTREPVFFSRIQPISADSKEFELFLYSFDPTDSAAIAGKKFSMRRYRINCETDTITFDWQLKRLSYKDVISTGNSEQILVRSYNNGVYRMIRVPKEARQ